MRCTSSHQFYFWIVNNISGEIGLRCFPDVSEPLPLLIMSAFRQILCESVCLHFLTSHSIKNLCNALRESIMKWKILAFYFRPRGLNQFECQWKKMKLHFIVYPLSAWTWVAQCWLFFSWQSVSVSQYWLLMMFRCIFAHKRAAPKAHCVAGSIRQSSESVPISR